MDAAPRSKKPRTKSSARKTNHTQNAANEILVENRSAIPVAPKNARYTETSTLAIHSGAELGLDPALEDLAARQVEGALDADLAELSLGQRLSALNGDDAENQGSESDNQDQPSQPKRQPDSLNVVPAHSLTRTLIQALHSSDLRLLETCLAHSNTDLIRNTVKRLPPQLALPLLLACTERLGRGARAANMKGGGGGASSQRGMVLTAWIKTTIIVHSAHFMTMPDLVARLAGLHATLTSRLALHESLLSLNGKLDMVLSQIEIRSSTAPASLTSRSHPVNHPDNVRQPTRYVEGESEDEGDQMNVEPPVESGDEEGSIEDVELGESEDDGDRDEDEDEDEDVFDDGDESDGSGPPFNEFADEDEDDEDESE